MKSIKRRITVVSVIVLTVVFSLATVASAAVAGQFKQLNAWFGDIKIKVSGQQVTGDKQPFIVDGTTYVPLRMLANIIGREIQWNGETYEIDISGDTTVEQLRQQVALRENELAKKNYEVYQLEQKIAELGGDVDDDDDDDSSSSTTPTKSLGTLEDDLNDDHEEYEDALFDITLTGDKDDIYLKIEIDLDDYGDEWDDLSESDLEDYVEDIYDDIHRYYSSAKVTGRFEDSYDEERLYNFSVSSSGTASIEEVVDLSELESELEDEYYDHFDYFNVSITLEEDNDEITYEITFDYDDEDYKDYWDDDITDSEVRVLMQNIYNDIEDEYEDYDIQGYVKDEDGSPTLATYTRTSSGSAKFTRK